MARESRPAFVRRKEGTDATDRTDCGMHADQSLAVVSSQPDPCYVFPKGLSLLSPRSFRIQDSDFGQNILSFLWKNRNSEQRTLAAYSRF